LIFVWFEMYVCGWKKEKRNVKAKRKASKKEGEI